MPLYRTPHPPAFLLRLILVLIVLASVLRADTATFRFGDGDGYWEVADTTLSEAAPDTTTNPAYSGEMSTGGNAPNQTQAVLVFSQLAENGRIPAGSTIQSARLYLRASNFTASTQISLYRLLTPVNERSTWNTTGGGIARDGIEAASSPTAVVPHNFSNGAWLDFDVTADVQDWVNGSARNYGWTIVNELNPSYITRFITRNHGTAASRPRLEVTFTPAAPRVGAAKSDADFFGGFDLTRPELPAALVSAIEAHNWPLARAEYVAFLRTRTWPRSQFSSATATPGTGRLAADTLAEKTLLGTYTLAGTTYTFPGAIDWRMIPAGSFLDFHYLLNRHNEWVALAEAYQSTGNPHYLTAPNGLADLVGQWVRALQVPDADLSHDSEGPRTGFRGIEVGYRLSETSLRAFLLASRSADFPADTLIEWAKSVHEQAEFLYQKSGLGNHLLIQCDGLANAATLFPEWQTSSAWMQWAMATVHTEISVGQVYPDGAQTELAPLYHNTVIYSAKRILRLARGNGITPPAGYVEALERMHDYLLVTANPRLRTPAVNDSDSQSVEWWFQDATDLDGNALFPGRSDYDWLASNGASGTTPTTLSNKLDWAGQVTLRTGWNITDPYLFFEGGPFGSGHQHEDKLSFLIHGHGYPLVIDPGRGSYDASSPYRAYVLSSQGHNTIGVDGFGQQRRLDNHPEQIHATSPFPIEFSTSPSFDYITAAYGELPGERYGEFGNLFNATHRRHILFIKPYGYIILDDVDGGSTRYDSRFHLDDRGANGHTLNPANGRMTLQAINGKSGLTITPWADPVSGAPLMTSSVLRGSTDPDPIDGWTFNGNSAATPSPTVTYTKAASGRQQLGYVFAPSPYNVTKQADATRLATTPNLAAMAVTWPGGEHPPVTLVVNLDYPAPFTWAGAPYSDRAIAVLNGTVHTFSSSYWLNPTAGSNLHWNDPSHWTPVGTPNSDNDLGGTLAANTNIYLGGNRSTRRISIQGEGRTLSLIGQQADGVAGGAQLTVQGAFSLNNGTLNAQGWTPVLDLSGGLSLTSATLGGGSNSWQMLTTTLADNTPLTLNGATLIFNRSGNASSLHLGTGGATLVGNNTFRVEKSTVTVERSLAGTGNLSITGGGTLALTAPSTRSGSTTLQAGTLRLEDPNALSAIGTVELAGGTTLAIPDADRTAGTLRLSGSATLALTGGGTIHFAASAAEVWSGSALLITGADASMPRVRFGYNAAALAAAQLAKIQFAAYPDVPARLDQAGWLYPDPSALWRFAHYGSAEVTAASADAALTPSGLANLLAYATGIAPQVAGGTSLALALAPDPEDAQKFELSFGHNPAAQDVVLSVDASPDLLDWDTVLWNSVEGTLVPELFLTTETHPDGTRTHTLQMDFQSPRLFLRLRALRP